MHREDEQLKCAYGRTMWKEQTRRILILCP